MKFYLLIGAIAFKSNFFYLYVEYPRHRGATGDLIWQDVASCSPKFLGIILPTHDSMARWRDEERIENSIYDILHDTESIKTCLSKKGYIVEEKRKINNKNLKSR